MRSISFTFLVILCFLFVYSCKEETSQTKRAVQDQSVTDPVSQSDSTEGQNVINDGKRADELATQRYFYPKKSHCGGAVYGIYKNKELIRIESSFGGEYGYSSRDIDFENNKIVKITYREYYAEYDKYMEKYPESESIDPEKLIYSDTLYVLEFGKATSFKKYAGKKLISTQVNKELLNELVNCSGAMKSELKTEKELVKN